MSNQAIDIAFGAWLCGSEIREKRRRYKRHTYGRQWDDSVTTSDGRIMAEGDYARSCGHQPQTNNLLRQMVKTVVGLWRRDMAAPDCGTDPEVVRRNSLRELDARMLEEFLMSGCAVQRVVTERRTGGEGVWVDNVSPDRFFVNPFSDPRGLDIESVGMLHDMSLREVTLRFSRGSEQRRRKIAEIYSEVNADAIRPQSSDAEATAFLHAAPGRCRVIELWTLEARSILKCFDPVRMRSFTIRASDRRKITAENRRRAETSRIATLDCDTLRWHCRWLSPDGQTLDSYDSPWPHSSHPFAVTFYPLTDGEVHPFVEDVIDQQRTINRLITLLNTIMSVSAKGALLYPTECLPFGMRIDSLAREWSKPGAIIPYTPTDRGEAPRQMTGTGTDCGASQLLSVEMKLFEQVSGVNSAIQGREVTANTSAALYDARTRNATTALVDVLGSFDSFIDKRNALIRDS